MSNQSLCMCIVLHQSLSIKIHCTVFFCYGQPEINPSQEWVQCELNALSVRSHRLYLNKGLKGLFQCLFS